MELLRRRRTLIRFRHLITVGIYAVFTIVFVLRVAVSEENSQALADGCPEQCGAVLKVCLETYLKRHGCLALTDACLGQCKAGVKVLDVKGKVLPEWYPRENDERMVVRW